MDTGTLKVFIIITIIFLTEINMPVFNPSNGQPLVVPNTLGYNMKTSMLPTTRKDFAGSRPATTSGTRFGQLSQNPFFRHNPHPGRVRHIKGLNDAPICAVHDDGILPLPVYRRRPPTSEMPQRSYQLPVPGMHYNNGLKSPSLHFQKGFDRQILLPNLSKKNNQKFGLIPMTDTWRDELRELTEKAGLGLPKELREQQQEQPRRTSVYSSDTGRLIPPPSRAMQRGFSRQRQREPQHFNHIQPEQANESLVLEMLCQILQTDSVSAIQSWLVSANSREKDLVLDMIRSAVVTEEERLQKQQFDPASYQQPPSNMNLQNGYGEVDKFYEDDHTRFSRYAYDNDNGRKNFSPQKSKENQGKSSKAEILRVHTPRAESPSKGSPKPSSR
ncbi:protein TBATA-like isoform X2 [Anneissia japonica]|uniref:protein TBATA-like isoform X2 n=1 Tax=Anneissia japonica TaxID=1529436 RepID=UPI0014258BCE|nr:protein TBATA-like isoform X2 [Anneissia japonica]